MNSVQPVLQIDNLEKTYAAKGRGQKQQLKKALAGVSFTLGPGLYGLLGPNGAGKSTLINIAIGMLRANKGQVLWNAKPIEKLGKKYRQILGYMPQQQTLYDRFTGRRFLHYFCALKEVAPRKVEQEVERVAAATNLQNELDKRLEAYSGGMKQRLLAAVALIGNPQLLILDEPSAGLDPKERVRLRELMAGLATDKIVLIATHVVSDVEHVANEILLLKEGQLVDKAPPQTLINRYAPGKGLEEVYLAIFGEEDEN